jgi:hypothetical protein
MFAEQVTSQIMSGTPSDQVSIDTRMSAIKPHLPQWLYAAVQQVEASGAIKRGWEKVGTSKFNDPKFLVSAMEALAAGKLFPGRTALDDKPPVIAAPDGEEAASAASTSESGTDEEERPSVAATVTAAKAAAVQQLAEK